MRQFIFTFLILAFSIVAGSARKVEHVVQRGETIEGIASKYGLSPQTILNGNNVDRVYVGLKLDIDIPDAPRDNTYRSNAAPRFISPEEESLAKEAMHEFEHKRYDKAVKHYNKLVKKFPSSTYYFNRGLAQFNRGKNRQAAEDFRRALTYADCSSYVEEHAPELIEVAEARHQQWKEEQSQLWGSLIAGTLVAGAQTWAAIESAKTYSDLAPMPVYNYESLYTGIYSPTPAYSGGTNMPDVYNSLMKLSMDQAMYQMQQQQSLFNNLMNVSLQQALYQAEQERNAVYNQFLNECNMMGVQPTEQMWGQYYARYLAVMYGNPSSDNSARSSNNSIDYKERRRNILNTTYGETCKACRGNGKCEACGGTKIATGMGLTYYCNVCKDDGKCPVCNGSGKTPWNR